jgi:hypothetical protein
MKGESTGNYNLILFNWLDKGVTKSITVGASFLSQVALTRTQQQLMQKKIFNIKQLVSYRKSVWSEYKTCNEMEEKEMHAIKRRCFIGIPTLQPNGETDFSPLIWTITAVTDSIIDVTRWNRFWNTIHTL